MQLAKLSINHSIGGTHSLRICNTRKTLLKKKVGSKQFVARKVKLQRGYSSRYQVAIWYGVRIITIIPGAK